MKKFAMLIQMMLLFLVAACGTDSGDSTTLNTKCNNHGCVTIFFDGEIHSSKPASFKVIVSTVEVVPELYVSLTPIGFEKFQILEIPLNAKLVYEDEQLVGWLMETKAGVEYEFSGQVMIPSPPHITGIYNYSIHVFIDFPGEGDIIHDLSIYIDGYGNQINAQQVKEYQETFEEIVPEVTGVIIFPTDTLPATFPPPTATETITPAPTATPTHTLTDTPVPYP